MKTIHYVDYDITTTDETSDAVLAYAQALALKDRSDTVHVSGFDAAGDAKEFDLLIGPASQIVAATSDLRVDDATDGHDAAEIRARINALAQENHVVPEASTDSFPDPDILCLN
jgi:hypothetical protein